MPPRKAPARSASIEDIRVTIISGKANDRASSLKELIEFASRADRIKLLKDKVIHQLLEAIFHCAIAEKTTYYGGTKTTKTQAENRLGLCAEALRTILTQRAARLKVKAARAVVDHITQVLPGPDQEFVTPLRQDYIKSLVALLGRPANVEQLCRNDAEGWLACADFFIDAISQSFGNGDRELSVPPRGSPAPGTSSTARSGTSISQRNGKEKGLRHLEDMVQCVLYLVSAINAPLRLRSSELTATVVQVLQLRDFNVSKMHQAAFESINSILSSLQGDDLTLVAGVVRDILALLSHWWQPHSSKNDKLLNSIRDEILRTIFILLPHIDALAQKPEDRSVLGDMEELLDALWLEYSRRDERARLQLADLDFSSISADYFCTRLFGLRPFHPAAERSWAVVEAIAALESIYSRNLRQRRLLSVEPEVDQPRKRRRIDEDRHRLYQRLRSAEDTMKLVALHSVPFQVAVETPPLSDFSDILGLMISLISHKQSAIASWAMIACASYAAFPLGKDVSLTTSWSQIWQVAVRSVSHQGTSRAACALLHSILESDLLPYHEIADSVNTIITTADISGPAVLVDASLVLMLHLLHLRNTMLPGASQATRSHITRWLFSKWNPADYTYATSHSRHADPLDIVNLLRACFGSQPFKSNSSTAVFGGYVYQYWRQQSEDSGMIDYLVLNPAGARKHGDRLICGSSTRAEAGANAADAADANAAKKLVLELLHPKLSESLGTAESWGGRGSHGEGAAQVSTERLQSLVYCALVGVMMLPQFEGMNTTLSREVEMASSALVDRILKAVLAAGETQHFSEICLSSVAAYLPGLNASDLTRFRKESKPLLELFSKLSLAISEKSSQQSSSAALDMMDLDDDFGSQASQGSSISKASPLPRSNIGVRFSREGFYADLTMRLRLLSIMLDDEGQIGLVPADFVEQLVSLSSDDFLFCRRLLQDILTSDSSINPEDARRLVEAVGTILGDSEYSTCEVALGTCIDLIEGFIPIWSNATLDVSTMVGDLYSYIVKTGLPSNDLSPRAQAWFADLLFALLEKNSDYGQALGLAPCRSTLLSVFQDGSLWLKFKIGAKLPNIFALFVFKVHDNLFVDILDCLPADPEHHEGIALRLFALAEIACRWPTLLRRCIYHIFETPGTVTKSDKHATRCLARVAHVLGLDSPKELFRLFTPQLLYTWLEANPMADMPFGIFGFATLEELLSQARVEITALMIMRGQEGDVQDLAKRLKVSTAQLIQLSFSRTMAYSIAHDISIPKDGQQTTSESRIRKILGKETFLECIHLNFVDIIGILFDLIDQEDPIERAFAKDPNLKYAADIMAKIKIHGHLAVDLPPNQQPMFKAKYLCKEIEHLCSRTEHELPTLWTPALVVSIARRLLNTVHPAMGPLHACSVIRKVRVLVCLAGAQATNSYPLEMLLHSVRPFVGDAECADDALGLTRYLVSSGVNHLAQVPSFLAGYSLSTLASLRMFLESSQSSTTQESQFKATKTNAEKFHSWFTKYLTDYDSSAFKDESQRAAFKSITQSAAHIRASGNAEKGTHESSLLMEILKDGEREHQLLNRSSRDLALGMLCGDFQVPYSGRTDIIETDSDAIAHGAMVWESCKSQSLQNEYLTWAGRVIGKSFVASGEIQEEFLRESRIADSTRAAAPEAGSEQGILDLLEALTTDRECHTAGLAESALRTVVSEAVAQRDAALQMVCQENLSEALMVSSDWSPYRTPPSDFTEPELTPDVDLFGAERIESPDWSQEMAMYLAKSVPQDVVLSVLPPLLQRAKGFAEEVFQFVVHLVLEFQLDKEQVIRRRLSAAIKDWLAVEKAEARENIKLVINTMLFLRTQPLANETSIADRSQWLDIDLPAASAAATRCGMFKVALLFAELALSETSSRASRRSSAVRDLDTTDSTEILLNIFENIDDPDAYYGLPQTSSLANVLARLEYEKDGIKGLAFRGAQYDSHVRQRDQQSEKDGQSLVHALGNLGLSGLSHSLLQTQQGLDGGVASMDSTFNAARRLEIWNLPVPSNYTSHSVTVYKAYQNIHQATDLTSARQAVHEGLAETVRHLTRNSLKASNLRLNLDVLAALTELDEILGVTDASELEGMFEKFDGRSRWMMSGRYEDVRQILSCRASTLSMLSQQSIIRGPKQLSSAEARLVEIRALLLSAGIYRFHDATQESLNIATSLNDLIGPCDAMGLSVDAAVKVEVASSFWDHGEMIPSIRMLQGIEKDSALKKQTIHVSRADLLAKIGHQVSVARLESPDSIQKKYLEPALKELKGASEGNEAGKVFHQFAVFCDEQLQNPDSMSDLNRLKGLEKGKSDEVAQLETLIHDTRDSQLKSKYTSHLGKAKQWLVLDQQELRRVEQTRNEFVKLSLENYLLSLTASDEHNNDALRFTALWLERAGEESTNEAVRKYVDKVPSRKLAPLINQLTSRLQDNASHFQRLLMNLVYRICVEHPYHGMYQIWSGTKSRTNREDEVAVLRQKATARISDLLSKHKSVSHIWHAVDRTNRCYHTLATEKNPTRYKQGAKVAIKDAQAGPALISTLAKYRIPPPTLQMELRADLDYSGVPTILKLEPNMAIASGISAPKIITAVGTDGAKYKQLVKGGNDDLRQDAIMEQVFAAVSSLLKHHRATRQRNLGIRTYKVLPLTATSGLIEFVPSTQPLHDYLMPAHEKYYPKDLKASHCRREVANAQGRTVDVRVAAYRRVAERFRPVMRYFFMENFQAPDEWFARRLAYTRTTAAISMLGHVLGLGDRHGHNILLDRVTGEVVHIDLGVAFEMGRVLPVPELVPFRLTRDIVDGMGITKTEGVFRRCCEFTMDALREETYSIMTILDVLRYDPLYSWSISPVRLAKLQDTTTRQRAGGGGTDDAAAAAATDDGGQAVVESRKAVNEPSEADRALEVVRKKLSKTLSVTATVNDLINQATSERNLAVLYSGWAAYA
ncbi:hypothetical protein GGTG_01179 [Gaeumannomyces tritici R3-111a-1]|uniref:Serine/threonine-protein kinase Tel1 n=1 Tax=Gaeumannomyces tritici (strain R3-111a-1) TaxID=644352 RepID=J3NIU5_GAET3|nr:hypothetical protein GGTG_01179 [Gaeumannomyces tritici R3-111a-1]EJT81195.1 hypothetical protein GGTG_01179 [Gaeumannomyces tritici R3-111a-1]